MDPQTEFDKLTALLGKSPHGHAVAYEKWIDLAYAANELIQDKPPWTPHTEAYGRTGFMAMAQDAIDRKDYPSFMDICIGAAVWEAKRMKL